MYNPFLRVAVLPNFIEGHVIQWKIDPAFSDAEPYTFTVEVSQAADFSEIDYTLTSVNEYLAIDNTNSKRAFLTNLNYRVKLVTADGKTYYSYKVLLGCEEEDRRQYRLATEITRKELLRMRKYTGTPGYLIKRKVFGKVKKDELDPITGVPITNNKGTYGTEFEGGYFSPLKIIFTYDDWGQERKLSQDGMGVIEHISCKLRLIGYPIIDAYDIIVDPKGGHRYNVQHVETEVFPGTSILINQIITASQIPITDPVYQIPVA